jgi:ABC-2 type transport system permease protein
MRGLSKFTWVEIKLFLREPFMAFFTLAFPLMMLFLFGSIYGNAPSRLFGGLGSVDVSVPGYAAMIIATSGLLSLNITIASQRELGILRRLKATPLRPQTILSGQVAVILLMTLVGMLLLVAAGKAVYNMRLPVNPLNVLAAFLISSLSFFAFGFVVAGFSPSARSAQIVGMVLFYPMLFLSGATIPREVLPATVQHYAQFLPLTHAVTLLRGMWFGDAWSLHLTEVGILTGLLIVAVAVSARTFRWE